MADATKLAVIICSTRPGRVGKPVGDWFGQVAESDPNFQTTLVDLAELALPLLDEPNHPLLGAYTQEHSKRWSEIVAAQDAFVFVLPEYNHSFNAATKNALDFLFNEWAHKAVGIVSYGGVSGGTRSAGALKPVLAALRLVPTVGSVIIPHVGTQVHDGVFTPAAGLDDAARAMLAELARLAEALRPLRG